MSLPLDGQDGIDFPRANVELVSSQKSVKLIVAHFFFDPSSPNSDENEISLYIINTCSNIQVMRIKEVITRYLDIGKFSLLAP